MTLNYCKFNYIAVGYYMIFYCNMKKNLIHCRELAVWNWHTGKCYEFKVDTRFKHSIIRVSCYL